MLSVSLFSSAVSELYVATLFYQMPTNSDLISYFYNLLCLFIRGNLGRYLYCWITPFNQSMQIFLPITLDSANALALPRELIEQVNHRNP